jgi:hypothetical protein
LTSIQFIRTLIHDRHLQHTNNDSTKERKRQAMKTKPFIYPAILPLILLSVIFSFAACGSSDHKDRSSPVMLQPYKDGGMWDWVAPIDGSGYCGPAALYHIINYYEDQGSYDYKEYDGEGWAWADQPLEIPAITEANPMFIDDTDFGQFIQRYETGSDWAMLDDVADLYSSQDENDRLYDVFVCSSNTSTEDIEVRRSRLNYIYENLFKKGIPVVIHLTSNIPFSGHYVALIGYDPDKEEVYYVDSLHHTSGIQAVDLEDFIGEWFYDGGDYYSARWDGQWMAFWHPENSVICDHCGN